MAATITEKLTARELIADDLFKDIPPKFLLWQDGLALRRVLKAGDVLCEEGDAGNTAYLIKKGKLEILAQGKVVDSRDENDLIVGEMACLSGTRRKAAVRAGTDGEVWEIRRNVLDRLMRVPSLRDRFETIYRKNSLGVVLRESDLFKALPAEVSKECADFLRPRLSFVRVNPGQMIFDQGEWSDSAYFVRLGNVKISIKAAGASSNIFYCAPGGLIGEIGLLALSPEDAYKDPKEVDSSLEAIFADSAMNLTSSLPAGRRSATCTALDHVELARISRAAFLEMIAKFPVVRKRLVEMALARLKADNQERPPTVREFVDQGLYQGQSLLVLDLTKCTRCDECTRACVEQHGTESHGAPLTRLLRVGKHFGDFLVATSCRSCRDAYCMIGCPVDAIHRGRHGQIVIEDHCIGCSLCANNCPYGNIEVTPDFTSTRKEADPDHPGKMMVVTPKKASTCDLCDAGGELKKPKPRCVHACPHDAAHRMTGPELLNIVTGAPGKK
jgi:CRP-like cAMP-binding protein/Fe-S-cluster-containing hydrogenase component 2